MLSFARWTGVCLLFGLLTLGAHGCDSGSMATSDTGGGGDGARDDANTSACPNGTDNDGDGYGLGCPKGKDCDDTDPLIHPGAKEVCDGEDNDCDGTGGRGRPQRLRHLRPRLRQARRQALPPGQHPGSGGQGRQRRRPRPQRRPDAGQDQDELQLHVDRQRLRHRPAPAAPQPSTTSSAAARSPRSTPTPQGGGALLHRHLPLQARRQRAASTSRQGHRQGPTPTAPRAPRWTTTSTSGLPTAPSRRPALGHQDRQRPAGLHRPQRQQGKIDTSEDLNGDGKIDLDCDGDGLPDSAAPSARAPSPASSPSSWRRRRVRPLHRQLRRHNDYRPLRLPRRGQEHRRLQRLGRHLHTSRAAPANHFYRIDGKTGRSSPAPTPCPPATTSTAAPWTPEHPLVHGHRPGPTDALNTINPTRWWPLAQGAAAEPRQENFYGITIDSDDHVWLGGWDSGQVYRYKPDRTSFASPGHGHLDQPSTAPAIFIAQPGHRRRQPGQGLGRRERGLHLAGGPEPRRRQPRPERRARATGRPTAPRSSGWGSTSTATSGASATTNHTACRASTWTAGQRRSPAGPRPRSCPVGTNPYTYSDFTGYGLQNFTRPQGRYLYQLRPARRGQGGVEAGQLERHGPAGAPPSTSRSARRLGHQPRRAGSAPTRPRRCCWRRTAPTRWSPTHR